MAYTTIDDPSAHHQTKIYTGNGNDGQAYTFDGNSDMQPDWLWVKNRNNTGPYSGHIFDSTRGANKSLFPDETNAELTNSAYGYLGAFQSDGFTVTSGSSGDERVNNNNDLYVMWGWKANGGTTTTNDASSTGVGTIDSVYQANTTAGFSIVTYTGTGSAGTIAHGLGAAPTVIIGKDRSDTSQWFVQHPAFGATHYGELDDTTAFADDANYFNDSTPTSTVFGIGSDGATGGTTNYVAYCFAPIQGYSKFGKYTGNGNADGPFIYLGFKPAWVMFKNTTTGHDWRILDNTRNTFNSNNTDLRPNTSAVESSSSDMDFLSNGIKIRDTDGDLNEDGSSHVYFAFAESPFVSSKGVPTTAR